MIGAELIAELDESSYNLNTSPYTVSNLQGDLYDYHFIIFCDSASTASGGLQVTLNADTGSNYDRYLMSGVTSTASATVSTSLSYFNIASLARNQSSRNSLAMGSLTGESGDKRKISCNSSSGYDPRLYVFDAYWTNTADEVTLITFTGSISASCKWHIMVYRVPKESVQGSWEYMKELSWSSETAEKSFTGLDGDTDIQYMLQWDGDQNLSIECNNDAGSNYTRQLLYNSSGTILALNQTVAGIGCGDNSRVIINAESGVDRLSHVSSSQTTSAQQSRTPYWWQNTGDNITSLDLTPGASATGTCKLYRKINPNTTSDPLPFETIKVFDVSGDYSAGDTLSGLTCDDYKMIKVEWLGVQNVAGTTYLRMQFNADTGSNYTYQYLNAFNSTTSAASGTIQYLGLTVGGDASETSHGVAYIYPKSGEYRPVLNKQMKDEDQIVFYADWWLNSADPIESIKVYADNTNSLSGQIKISVLRDHNFGAMTASSLLLNGSTQYLTVTDNVDFTVSAFSIEVWFKLSSTAGLNTLFRNKSYGAPASSSGFALEIEDGQWANTIFADDAGNYITLDGAQGTVSTGVWTQIIMTYASGTLKLYQNGSDLSVTTTNSGTPASSNSSNDVEIGAFSGSRHIDGSIAFTNMFNVALTASEVTTLYNGGVPKQPWLLSQSLKDDAVLLLPLNSETDSNEYSDYSGNANDATATGSPTITGEDITVISGPDPSP